MASAIEANEPAFKAAKIDLSVRLPDVGPDVVLLDIGMPGMDGYETCRRIRIEPFASNLHIIALTGWGQEQDKKQALDAGFDAHLTKPADPAVLERILALRTATVARPTPRVLPWTGADMPDIPILLRHH